MIGLDLAIAFAAGGWTLALGLIYAMRVERQDHDRRVRHLCRALLRAQQLDPRDYMTPEERAAAELEWESRRLRGDG